MSKFVSEPSFCYIAPTKYLEYTTRSSTHLVLAHLIMGGHDEYVEFYKSRADAGDIIFCDNSAFELGASFDPNLLIEAAHKVGAKSLVLPDYPGQSSELTIRAAEEWIPKFRAAGLAPFFVPQGKKGDLQDWMVAYEWASRVAEIDIIGMSILGIPNALPNVPAHMARVVVAELLNYSNTWGDKHHHWLGLNSPDEIESLLNMGVIDTLDSSSPIQYGIQGLAYVPHLNGWGVPKKTFVQHVDFNAPMHRGARPIVEHNVAVVGGLFDEYNKDRAE